MSRGVHHLVRVVRGRVLHHGDLVAQLGGVANGRFDAGVRDHPDDDELMSAVFLELQVQVGVGEAAGAPIFLCDNLTWRWHEFGAERATPCAEFEALVLPRGSLNRRNVGPRFVGMFQSFMLALDDRLPVGIGDVPDATAFMHLGL